MVYRAYVKGRSTNGWSPQKSHGFFIMAKHFCLYPSSHNHGSVENGCISSRIVSFHVGWFSTSMTMGERGFLKTVHFWGSWRPTTVADVDVESDTSPKDPDFLETWGAGNLYQGVVGWNDILLLQKTWLRFFVEVIFGWDFWRRWFLGVPSTNQTTKRTHTRWAPSSHKWSYGAPINSLING